jgi:hypothetical protein
MLNFRDLHKTYLISTTLIMNYTHLEFFESRHSLAGMEPYTDDSSTPLSLIPSSHSSSFQWSHHIVISIIHHFSSHVNPPSRSSYYTIVLSSPLLNYPSCLDCFSIPLILHPDHSLPHNALHPIISHFPTCIKSFFLKMTTTGISINTIINEKFLKTTSNKC